MENLRVNGKKMLGTLTYGKPGSGKEKNIEVEIINFVPGKKEPIAIFITADGCLGYEDVTCFDKIRFVEFQRETECARYRITENDNTNMAID